MGIQISPASGGVALISAADELKVDKRLRKRLDKPPLNEALPADEADLAAGGRATWRSHIRVCMYRRLLQGPHS